MSIPSRLKALATVVKHLSQIPQHRALPSTVTRKIIATTPERVADWVALTATDMDLDCETELINWLESPKPRSAQDLLKLAESILPAFKKKRNIAEENFTKKMCHVGEYNILPLVADIETKISEDLILKYISSFVVPTSMKNLIDLTNRLCLAADDSPLSIRSRYAYSSVSPSGLSSLLYFYLLFSSV